MSLRYKIGDRIKTLEKIPDSVCADEVGNQIYTIEEVDAKDERLPYRIKHRCWAYWINDDCIDHEATAKLNNKSNDDSIGGVMSIDMSSYITRRIDCEGGEAMNANEILEKWKNKRICEIETEYRNKKDQLTKEDEIAKLIEKHIAQMNKTIKEKYDGVEKAVQVAVIRTPETDEKINLAEEEMSNKKLNIKKKIEEIKAVLEVAENQDKVFEILNKQGIIDKNYNIL
jgi:hypothetical protein